MKVVLFGHSYVRDLVRLSQSVIDINSSVSLEISHSAFPGAKFSHFLENPDKLQDLFHVQPEFVVVILGGNDFDDKTPLSVVCDRARAFYHLLRSNLPKTKIYATQVECRFYKPNNRFECPETAQYKKITTYFNKFLKKLSYIDNLICILGPNRLSNRALFKADGVHLTPEGVHKLWDIIRSFLVRKTSEQDQ